MAVNVHVVAGFLGTGKTTVLRHLLASLRSERIGVVVNDFGEAALDRDLLGGASDERVREIRGSCVCCTAPEGFVGEVGALLAEGTLDRIFVEPTGIARPADVIDTLRRAPYAADLVLGPLIVVVDPRRIARGELPAEVVEQAAAADVLVANRVDTATDDDRAAFRAWVANLWPQPQAVVETSFGVVESGILAWAAEPLVREASPTDAHAHAHAHGHDHSHGFDVLTWQWSPQTVFHRGRLLAAVEAVGAERLKGVFRTDEGTVLVQIAAGQLTEEPSPRRSDSRVDVIVAHGASEALDAAEARFADAVLREEELVLRAQTLEVALPDGRVRTFDRGTLAGLPGGIADVSSLIPGRAGAAAGLWRVLEEAEATDGSQAVVVAADGYVTEPVPLDALRSAVLVHSLAGAPLPGPKGGPFRLLIPGDAGPGGPCANVKGVVRIAIRGPT